MIATLFGLAAATASADPRYEVMNAPEGVYWRSEPNWAAAERISGFGVYNGTIIEVHCYQSGTAVEGSADTMWEQATDVGGSGYGSGWVDEHFINDGQPIDAPSPGVPPCNPPPPPEEHSPPPPEEQPSNGGSGLVFPIFNAEGGIYYRSSPHWADTSATPGVGVYNGDQVQLICGAFGDAVGPFNDTAWSYVNNLSRSVGDGWVDEHFIDDGAADNSFVTGEPMCGQEIPGMSSGGSSAGGPGSSGSSSGGSTPSTPSPTTGTALYYSPYPANPHGRNSTGEIELSNRTWVPAPAPKGTITMSANEWDKADTKHCPALKSFVPANQSASISTLAAWSKARSAPFLLLKESKSWLSRIHYILLFDPGTQAELDNSPCDRKYNMGLILQEWLTTSSTNRLVILSGQVTADRGHVTEIGLGHAGIQDTFFTPLKVLGDKPGHPPRTQIIVCNYDTMSHEEVWMKYSSWILKPPIMLSTCPSWPGHSVMAWNP
ncbi:MAG TPA: hypothetical protein VG147_04205 [Solirubrobacteraceae bacterium]|jgi:hypothetical protein|nr:hypothetical protein [Solirubrobacteraceae bacterium]